MSRRPIQNDVVSTPSPTSPGEKPGRPSYKCIPCDKLFAQMQGLLCHQREKHQPRFECSRSDCDHKWTQSRTSGYKDHLGKKHGLENAEIDKILAQPPRREVIKSDLPPHFSPPPIDVHHAPTPLIPPVAHNPRLGHGEPGITTTELGIEHLAAIHAPSRLLSEEDSALVKGHFYNHGRFLFPSGHLGTANPGIHIRAPPVYPTGHSPSRGAVQAAAAPAHYQQSMAMSHASLKRNPPSFRVVPPLPYSRAPPVMSPASYETRPMFNETRDIQVADPEPTIKKKRKRANARQLEALNGMYARTAFPSTEERLQLAKDLDMSARIVQIWFQNKRQAQRQGGRNPGDSGSSISEVSITLPPDEPPVRVHLRSGATPVAMSPGEVLHPTSRSPQGQSVTGRSGQQTPSPPRSRSRADIDSRRYWPGGPGY